MLLKCYYVITLSHKFQPIDCEYVVEYVCSPVNIIGITSPLIIIFVSFQIILIIFKMKLKKLRYIIFLAGYLKPAKSDMFVTKHIILIVFKYILTWLTCTYVHTFHTKCKSDMFFLGDVFKYIWTWLTIIFKLEDLGFRDFHFVDVLYIII